MDNRIITYNHFIEILIREYGENLLKSKKYKIYEYCIEIDLVHEVFNDNMSDIDFFYMIPGLNEFFCVCDEIYVYTQCNYVADMTDELAFSVIKGGELPRFIENYGGAFFNNCPIIFNLNSDKSYIHRSESPDGKDICIFRDYTNIKNKFSAQKQVSIF